MKLLKNKVVKNKSVNKKYKKSNRKYLPLIKE